MKKIFSLFAAVLFAGSVFATEVTFTKEDFAGQGTANTGSEVSATKDGVTFTYSKGYCADESLRCYAHGALSITASKTIEKINFTTTGGKTGGLDAEVEVGATSYSVADLASQARFTEIKVTLAGGGETPETKPTTAPATPKQAEADVMGIYCSHYTTNNANFAISGWAGGYETLDLSGTKVASWTDFTWECVIDPAHQEEAHDYSAYQKVHVDMWAPAAAKFKFTAEAISGGNYKNGNVVELKKGWNSFDFALAEWPENYDFKNFKCFTLEQYQTPEGESFEHNPFAIANIYFWKEAVLPDPTNCAEAREAALSVSANNEEYNGGKVYTIEGFVTEIAYAWKDGSMSFWMADTKDGGKVLEAYKCAIADEADAVRVGDKVAVTGKLTKFNTTPEFAAGCTVEIVERAAEPVNLGEKTIAEFLALQNTKDTCVLTGKVIEIVNDEYGNLTIEDATGSLYVFGVLTPAKESKKFAELDVAVNDVLTIKAIYNEYQGNPQAKNAIFVSREKATPSAIDNATVAGKAQKMIIDGQLFIIRDGVMFNANGAAVK